MNTKTCTKCGIKKIATTEFFHATPKGKYGLKGQCKTCRSEYDAKHSSKPEVKKRRNERNKKRQQSDAQYLLGKNLRCRLYTALQGKTKSAATLELLGCNIEHLKSHLENQFTDGMSWENYGKHGWHVDHIIPCASFDLSDPAQQRECFHFSNLQPLWAEENISKGAKVIISK